MSGQAIALKVIASVPIDCRFWMEDDGWNGQCERFLIHVRAPHFEEIKRRMESAIEAHIASVLDQAEKANTARNEAMRVEEEDKIA